MKLILSTRIAEQIEADVLQIAPGCAIVHIDDEGNVDGDISDADAYLRWWTSAAILRKVILGAPRLRWIHTPSAGVEHLLTIQELRESQISLTNSAGAQAVPIAEFVMLYMLAHVKRVPELFKLQANNAWDYEERAELDELAGKVLLIIGLGSIGQELARRAVAFGMHVIGSRRNPAPIEGVERVVGADQWRELLPEADFVVLATPLTAETRHMIGSAELASMKKSSYLINIARGPVLDGEALYTALQQGTIAGAALDVTDPEPLPVENPLWQAPNLWITPHISYLSPRTPQRMIGLFLDNLQRFVRGEPLRNVVDKRAGY